MIERARAIPGVRSVAATDMLPLSSRLQLEHASTSKASRSASKSELPLAIPYSVSPDYFETMGITLRGRDFLPNENKKESRVAIVNETFARNFLPGQDAIGKRYNLTGPNDPFWEIIGVVPDGKYNTLGEEPKAVRFRPHCAISIRTFTLVARTEGDPRTVLAAMPPRAAAARSDSAALRREDADRTHEHSAFPGEDRGGRARKFWCARARACRGRNLRRDVLRGRGTHARDRVAHGARRAIAQRRPAHSETGNDASTDRISDWIGARVWWNKIAAKHSLRRERGRSGDVCDRCVSARHSSRCSLAGYPPIAPRASIR